ncbi:hypothetical protein M406DRAFT_75497 [Cryphonectria parasitica EP155]|uniref:Uncharacterized protein n=1 Tax=Cryphonectria parasitica (strain ATCC 38755 / EP155) TaxID=660469 RepID=A0A9P4Y7N4_CRYP1|nr:uncharacterized protein M406DRAFT_75497 [Cryphonectria parasitica EP155]KAF3768238.1 hypothetical protein M406DRAFT_75497 [Cryphonectria parasitica EP155]
MPDVTRNASGDYYTEVPIKNLFEGGLYNSPSMAVHLAPVHPGQAAGGGGSREAFLPGGDIRPTTRQPLWSEQGEVFHIRNLEQQVRNYEEIADQIKKLEAEKNSLQQYIILLQSCLADAQAKPPSNINLSMTPGASSPHAHGLPPLVRDLVCSSPGELTPNTSSTIGSDTLNIATQAPKLADHMLLHRRVSDDKTESAMALSDRACLPSHPISSTQSTDTRASSSSVLSIHAILNPADLEEEQCIHERMNFGLSSSSSCHPSPVNNSTTTTNTTTNELAQGKKTATSQSSNPRPAAPTPPLERQRRYLAERKGP